MKFGLYPRLALAGIRKNKRLYIPYLLTCTGMAMMYYIIIFLQHNEMLDGMRGGTTASTILALGGWVVAIFVCIFLFYIILIQSFLNKSRCDRIIVIFYMKSFSQRLICHSIIRNPL